MTLNFTPQGLPVFTLETLPLVQWAAVIVEDNSSKLWKNCQNCLVSPSSLGRRAFPRCEACARVRSADPARYCSQACQREHWHYHAPFCDRNYFFDKDIRDSLPSNEADFTLSQYRQANRWVIGVEFALKWAVKQAYMMSSMEHTERICLRIWLQMADSSHSQSPLWPERFEFIPFDAGRVLYEIPEPITRPIGHYSIVLNHMIVESAWIYLDEDAMFGEDSSDDEDNRYDKKLDIRYRSVLRPQWPWILGHCLVVGDIAPYISNVRLLALLYALDNFGNPKLHNHLQKFSVPKFTKEFTLKQETLNEWLNLMYPVVASFGSRFRDPCSLIKNSYGPLLLQCGPGIP